MGPDAILLGQFSHNGGLAAGAGYTRTESVQLPGCTEGNYYLYVRADSANTLNVAPACQLNNPLRSATALPVRLGSYPDLAISDISAPSSADPGQPMSLSWVTTNAGPVAANPPWVDAVYLSTDYSFNPTNRLLLGYYPESAPLAPGAGRLHTASFTVPDSPGIYWLAIEADASNTVEECQSEGNNLKVGGLINVPITHYPELHVTSVRVPSAARAGQPITVTWVVTNEGTEPTPQTSWSDTLVLSPDQSANLSSFSYLGAFPNVRSLGVGQSYTNSASVVLPPGEAGPLYVLVLPDSGRSFYEGESATHGVGWNPDAMLVSLPAPANLAPSNVTLTPASGAPGNQITVGWTVSNLSANDTINEWSDAVYLSTNTSWDLNATFLGSVDHTGLAASGSYDASWTGPLPALNPGSYHAIVRADVRNTAPELSPSGHTASSASAIAVDVPVTGPRQNGDQSTQHGRRPVLQSQLPAGTDREGGSRRNLAHQCE